jgi:hypothetical protein
MRLPGGFSQRLTMTTKATKPKAASAAKTKKTPAPAPVPAPSPVAPARSPAPAAPAAPAAASPVLKRVRFHYPNPGATTVFLAGTFNQWHPSSKPLQATAAGWVLELELPPGSYEYRFIVDGAWVTDPAASEMVSNPFGGDNSVVRVA